MHPPERPIQSSLYLIDRAICNPNEVVTIVSDTARNLRDGALRDFKQIMISLERWNRDQFNKSESKYEFKNGSIIEFLGADEPDKFRGPRRDRLYVNEANRIHFETFNQMNARTRKEVFLDWNPTAPFWYEENVKGKIPCEELRLTYLDNESLTKIEVEEFERRRDLAETSNYWWNWWQVYGLGLSGRIEGACIKDYKVVDSIPDGYFLKGIGLDFGVNDPNSAIALYKNDEGKFIFDEVLYKNKITLSEIYDSLKNIDTIVYADYAWKQNLIELERMGLNIKKCRKGANSIQQGIDLINEKEVSVTRSSENLLNEFELYRYKMDKNGNLEDGKFEGPDHAVDACRYVLKENTKPEFYIV